MSLRNNRGRATALSAVLCGLLYCFSTNAFSTDAFSANASSANAGASTQEARVAEQRPANYSIDLSKSPSRQFTIDTLDAAFVKIHFDYFKLPKGMSIEVSDPLRREIYRYGNRERDGFTVDKAMGQNGTTSFSAMSISGPAAVVRLVGVAQEPWTRAHAVRVTRMLEGYPEDMLDAVQPEALRGDVGTRATCVNDKRSAVCYSATDPTAYDRSRPVARLVLARGSNCTAWRVGPGNHMFTNQHCIRTADEAASAEVWFNYQSTTCGGTTSGPVVKVTGASLLKNHGSLDFALFTVNNFASISQFGYLGLDVRTPLQNEQIAIPQHPGARLKELAVVSNHVGGARCIIDVPLHDNLWGTLSDTAYQCDTEGGSSGSPVISRTSNKVLALHHVTYGSCLNGGVQFAYIWPQVSSFFGGVVPNGDNGGTPSNSPPVANFSFATSALTVTFTDSSTDSDGTIASRLWTFGDGSTSTLTNPSRTYAAAGTYSVSLKVTDNGGLSTTITKSVTVSATNTPPVANFSFTTSGLTATFTDSSTDAGGAIASRSWNFGDGSTSTLANPGKTYAAGGTYSVVLTVTDNGGLTHTVTKSVTVSAGTGGAFFQNLTDYAINDNSTVDSPITVTGVTGNAPAALKVAVRIIHTFPSDVRVDLVAPDGSLYNIHNRTSGTNIIKTVTINASSEVANGVWKLRANDNIGGDTGYIDSWSMQF